MEIKDYVGLGNNTICVDANRNIIKCDSDYSESQIRTRDSFSYKWGRKDTYDNDKIKNDTRKWLMNKYFGCDHSLFSEIFHTGDVVLDAGCGAALSAQCLLWNFFDNINYIGVDISDSVYVAFDRLKNSGYDMTKKWFIKSDLNCIPLKNKVDVIFSEGVLHHTDSTENAIFNLSQLLKQGGWFLFYVYAKKGPIREFTDDYIRDYFRDKTDDNTWKELEALTRFGKYLGDLDLKLNIPEDIPFLSIRKGEIDLQRFFYWYIFKCYYKPDYSIDEMNHINFDWYRPSNCWRSTPDQVREWCEKSNLEIIRLNMEEAGITVIARKN